MFKANIKNTRTTPGIVLVSLLISLNIFHIFSSVSIVNFDQVNTAKVTAHLKNFLKSRLLRCVKI